MDRRVSEPDPVARAEGAAPLPALVADRGRRPRVELLGVGIAPVNLEELMGRVVAFVHSGSLHTVMYVNVHCLNVAYRDREYRTALNSADLVYCDGMGVVLGAWLCGARLPGRMTGADWIHDLCRTCVAHDISVYFLGGPPGVAQQAASVLVDLYPGLRVVGCDCGYFDHKASEEVIGRIREARPQILLVGLGTPRQEDWIARHYRELGVPVCWAVGGLFEFVTGREPRAPRWMAQHGLEWLFRLMNEPGRLWKRYLLGNPRFLWRVLTWRWRSAKG